jgi:hypothetical protein
MTRVTDQPGRVLAVLVVAPYLAYRGLRCGDPLLVAIGVVLFAWDLYWLLHREPLRARDAT